MLACNAVIRIFLSQISAFFFINRIINPCFRGIFFRFGYRMSFTGYNIDYPAESIGSEHPGCRSLKNFNPANIRKFQRYVQVVMTGLRVRDIYSVEQDQYLIKGATPYTYIGLYAVNTALTNINSGHIIQQLINAFYGHFLNFLLVNNSDYTTNSRVKICFFSAHFNFIEVNALFF